MAEIAPEDTDAITSTPPPPYEPPKQQSVSLNGHIIGAVDSAIHDQPSTRHILITFSRVPVLWNEEYKPYYKYSYIAATPHNIPILEHPLEARLKEDLGFLESNMYMRTPTHSVSLYVRKRRQQSTGEIVKVLEVDMVPKYRGYDAANEKRAAWEGKEEVKLHGLRKWVKCKWRHDAAGGECDCVLDDRTVWDEVTIVEL